MMSMQHASWMFVLISTWDSLHATFFRSFSAFDTYQHHGFEAFFFLRPIALVWTKCNQNLSQTW